MQFIKLFEKFRNRRKVLKDIDKGKEGIGEISKKIDPKHKDVDSPLKTLKVVLEEIREEMGLKDRIKYINSGMWGMAFKVGEKAIKLTSNKEEVKIAKKLVGKKIPNVVNYYEVLKVEEYGIWAILMDLVDELTKKERRLVDIFEGCLDWDDVMDEIEDRDISKSEAKDLWREYQKLTKSLEKSGIPTADMHSGNIGRLDGKLVHFDIMPETGKDEISKLSGTQSS